MESPFFSYTPPHEPPLSIFIEHRNSGQGHWEPAASVRLTGSLRTSGFLSALPPEEFRHFLLLLTFLTNNGIVAPTLSQIAEGLQVPEFRARLHMKRLTARRWLDQPIVLPARYASGIESYMLMPSFLPVEEEKEAQEPLTVPQAIRTVPREEIIALSRQHYARPRAEVEREIEAQLREGRRENQASPAPQDPATGTPNPLREQLINVGLEEGQADYLIAHFDALRIQRQLHWLPQRAVKNRAGFLIAAIKDNYGPPGRVRAALSSVQEAEPQTHHESSNEPLTPPDAA